MTVYPPWPQTVDLNLYHSWPRDVQLAYEVEFNRLSGEDLVGLNAIRVDVSTKYVIVKHHPTDESGQVTNGPTHVTLYERQNT